MNHLLEPARSTRPMDSLARAVAAIAFLALAVGCGGDDGASGDQDAGGGAAGTGATAGTGGGGGQAGKGGTGGVAGKGGTGGTSPGGSGGTGGTSPGGSGGTGGGTGGVGGTGGSGGAPTQCPGKLSQVDTSANRQTVGTGAPDSCTEAALHAAVTAVAGSGAIVFNCGGAATITLTSPLMVATPKEGTVIIDGGGVITISGGSTTRILDLDNWSNLVVQRITLKDGFVAAGEPDVTNRQSNAGAAIRHSWFGNLKAIDTRFENNHCASLDGETGGGAIFAGGLDDITLSGCEFVNNSASNGGGLMNRGSNLTIIDSGFRGNGALSSGDGQYGNGGGVYIDGMNNEHTSGNLTICGTVFENNTGMEAGSALFSYFYKGQASTIQDTVFSANKFNNNGTGLGQLYHEGADQVSVLTITNVTFSNATGGQHAGAIFQGQNSEATYANCTFANNKVSGNGAGLFNGAATSHFVNCTFSGNDADYGPAIFKGNSAIVTLKNTIFSNNTTANQYSATSCHEAMTDQGGNMQWPQNKPNSGNPDQACVDGITFADPLLEPLGDNGGVSQTFALGAGSPAINFAKDCPATDQRGLPRSSPCDSGSYEVQ